MPSAEGSNQRSDFHAAPQRVCAQPLYVRRTKVDVRVRRVSGDPRMRKHAVE